MGRVSLFSLAITLWVLPLCGFEVVGRRKKEILGVDGPCVLPSVFLAARLSAVFGGSQCGFESAVHCG